MTLLHPFDYYASTPKAGRFVREVNGLFEFGISKGERKQLRKLETMKFRVEPASISVCYPIIAENRRRKGRPYSMSKEDWELIAHETKVYSFCVMPGLLAAALCVRVEPKTLFCQAWGDASGLEKISPVVLLCKGIYDWCADNGFTKLDIGTAENNESLKAFKRHLGFKELG